MRQVNWVTTAAVGVIVGATVYITACERSQPSQASDSTASAPGTLTAANDSASAAAGSIPSGYVAYPDRPSGTLAGTSYVPDGTGRWEVRTGASHILSSHADTGYSKYRATVTIEQLEKPEHPEAFGIFFGGQSLADTANRVYTYFIVRGDGKYMIRVREGAEVRTLQDWTAHNAIPKENGGGKAAYGITVDVADNAAHVSVNGKPVATISGDDAPLDGITGVRINHGLHVMVTPIAITW